MTTTTEALPAPLTQEAFDKLVLAILHSRFPHETFTIRSQQASVLFTVFRYASADRLVNRTTLMEELGIQRTSADNIIKLMESRGILYRNRARGRNKPGQPIDLYIREDALEAFVQEHKRLGRRVIGLDLLS